MATPKADANGYIHAHGIFVKTPGKARGEWLTSNFTTTNRRVHAALARTVTEYEKFQRTKQTDYAYSSTVCEQWPLCEEEQ